MRIVLCTLYGEPVDAGVIAITTRELVKSTMTTADAMVAIFQFTVFPLQVRLLEVDYMSAISNITADATPKSDAWQRLFELLPALRTDSGVRGDIGPAF